MRVAVLVQSRPATGRIDQIDTFDQAREVAECLHQLGHEALEAEYADHGEATTRNLEIANPDVVFNLVEEVPEGPHRVHLATALLDRLGLRYTGARTRQLEALGDKRTMKAWLAAAGLPVVPALGEAPNDATFIVKSAIEHGSLGLEAGNVVKGAEAARGLIEERTASFGGEWFAEKYIDGREFDVALLTGPQGTIVLPVAEMCFLNPGDGNPKVFGYIGKWITDSPEAAGLIRHFPPPEPVIADVQRLALAAWESFGLSGFAHVDFRVDREGRPAILEINANPCIIRAAGFCDAATQAGLSQTDVVAALLAAA